MPRVDVPTGWDSKVGRMIHSFIEADSDPTLALAAAGHQPATISWHLLWMVHLQQILVDPTSKAGFRLWDDEYDSYVNAA